MKNAFQNLIKENTNNSLFLPFSFLIISIPLGFAINNIAMGIFVLIAILKNKQSNFSINNVLLLPIALFGLMALSVFWSIDRNSSINALSKEISLLLIPLVFLFYNKFSRKQKQKHIALYSYSIIALTIYYLSRAIIRFLITHDKKVFFYHGTNDVDYGLVPKLLNAIHVSVFVAIAFFYFFTKKTKTTLDYVFSLLLFSFIILLSSKNVIIVFILLILVYIFFYSNAAYKMRLKNLIVFGIILITLFSVGIIKERFQVEFQKNTDKSISTNVVETIPQGVHNVSILEAWTNPVFTPNDYFNGTAFRVYQFRIFLELIKENNTYLQGFGLNASYSKIKEKAQQYNLYMGFQGDSDSGYQTKNFHNQYIQIFAELGVFGFLIIIIMLFYNVKNAIKSKDFVFFAFAFLMISLFLTESFLWRQRGVVFFTAFYCLFNSGQFLHTKEPKQSA